jgi:uncharacterized SAM-binding protein YcdF (DUF218 family)
MFKAFLVTLVFILFGVTVVLPWYLGPNDLASCSQKPDPLIVRCAPADAIVAISGGDTAARTQEAITLYQNGWAPKLIFSGAARDTSSPSNAAAMKRQATDAGIPVSAITVEEFARDTQENAEKIQSITSGKNVQRLILVTSAYHQRRANIEFRHTFTPATQIINHPVPIDKHWSVLWWLTPSGWWLAISEVVKIIALYVKGAA